MKFITTIREELQNEQEYDISASKQLNSVKFSDYPEAFEEDLVVEALASENLIFEEILKPVIDDAVLNSKYPVFIANGPRASGKTHLIEGILSQEEELGQLFQIFDYLLQNEAQFIKIAAFGGSYSEIYDLYNYTGQMFNEYKTESIMPEIRFDDQVYEHLENQQDLVQFVYLVRQNYKQLSHIKTLFHRTYLFKFELLGEIFEILLIDASLYSPADLRLRNLLSIYIENSESIIKQKDKMANMQVSLQKSIHNDIITQNSMLGKSKPLQKQYKNQISVRESRFLSPFRDFFEEKGEVVIITCLSQIETFYQLKRDSEWYQICCKTKNCRSEKVKQNIIEVSERNVKSQVNDSRTAKFAPEETVEVPLRLDETNNLNITELDFEQKEEESFTEASETDELLSKITGNIEQLRESRVNNQNRNSNNMLYNSESAPINIEAGSINSDAVEESNHMPDYEELAANKYDVSAAHSQTCVNTKCIDPPPNINDAELQTSQLEPEQSEECAGNDIVDQLSFNLAELRQDNQLLIAQVNQQSCELAEYEDQLEKQRNQVLQLESENVKLNGQIEGEFRLEQYFQSNSAVSVPTSTASGSSDHELILQQELAAKEVLVDQLKKDYEDLQESHAETQYELAELRLEQADYDKTRETSAVLSQEVSDLREQLSDCNSRQQEYIQEIATLQARNALLQEQLEQAIQEFQKSKGFEQSAIRYEQETLVQKSAMYEMEAELDELRRRLAQKDTEIQRMQFNYEQKVTEDRYIKCEDAQ